MRFPEGIFRESSSFEPSRPDPARQKSLRSGQDGNHSAVGLLLRDLIVVRNLEDLELSVTTVQ